MTGLHTVNARLLINGGGFRLSSYEARFVKETDKLRKLVTSWLGSNTTVQQKHTWAHVHTRTECIHVLHLPQLLVPQNSSVRTEARRLVPMNQAGWSLLLLG